jgi:hypothetical protein
VRVVGIVLAILGVARKKSKRCMRGGIFGGFTIGWGVFLGLSSENKVFLRLRNSPSKSYEHRSERRGNRAVVVIALVKDELRILWAWQVKSDSISDYTTPVLRYIYCCAKDFQ